MGANSIFPGEGLGTKQQGIIISIRQARLQTKGACCLGQDVLVGAIEKGDHGPAGIESEGPQLGEGREGRIMGALGEGVAMFIEGGSGRGLITEIRAGWAKKIIPISVRGVGVDGRGGRTCGTRALGPVARFGRENPSSRDWPWLMKHWKPHNDSPRFFSPSRVANAFEGTTSLTRREMFSGADHPVAIGSTRYMMNVDRSQA